MRHSAKRHSMLSVFNVERSNKSHYAKCCYSECHFVKWCGPRNKSLRVSLMLFFLPVIFVVVVVESHCDDRHYARCFYADCHGTQNKSSRASLMLKSLFLLLLLLLLLCHNKI
jgi:hypothetical protein